MNLLFIRFLAENQLWRIYPKKNAMNTTQQKGIEIIDNLAEWVLPQENYKFISENEDPLNSTTHKLLYHNE